MAGAPKELTYWQAEVETYERNFDKFLRRGRKITKRYKDIRGSVNDDQRTRYNILWANTQTRMPALYARNPKAEVERRYKDSDPIGRVASQILERAIQYTLDHCNDTWAVNRQCILDHELAGRGVCWVRYEPHFKAMELPGSAGLEGAQAPTGEGVTQHTEPGPLGAPEEPAPDQNDTVNGRQIKSQGFQVDNAPTDPAGETLDYEECKIDYVFWEDFGHTWARVWQDVGAVWRRVYMSRKELAARFGASALVPDGLTPEQIEDIPLDFNPKNLSDAAVKTGPGNKKAIVYELWDKRDRQVFWFVKNYPVWLDQREDPLGLEGFWPMPRPLYANLANDDLVPSPPFVFYQDQAHEIDELSTRIQSITRALKVAGVRDASAEGLDRLLSEGVENALVPVDGWAALKEKGGLAGTFELLPLADIATALGQLREQRQAVIEDVYQLTGISDIVRGMSDPTETATAQQLKGQFSMLRIEDDQQEVQRFCRDQVRILGQIIAGYDIETLKAISGVKLLTNAEKAMLQMQLQQATMLQQQAQQQPGPPPGAPAAPGGPSTPPGAVAPPHPPMAPPGPPPQAMHPSLPAAPGGGLPPPQAGLPPQPPGIQSAMTPSGAPPGAQAGGPAGGMHPMAPGLSGTPAPGQAPLSPDKLKLLEEPTWEEVAALLENPVLREFRLDIETDSTVKMDEEAEKAARVELITAISGFIEKMVQAGAQAPAIMPMLGELLMFGVRAFKSARAIEQTFEDMQAALVKQSKQPPPPPPEILKAQADAQSQKDLAQIKAQSDIAIAQGQQAAQQKQSDAEIQAEMQRDQFKAQLDAETTKQVEGIKAQHEQAMADLSNHFESQRAQFEAASKERLQRMQDATQLQLQTMKQEHEAAESRKDRDHAKTVESMKAKAQAQKPAADAA